MKGGRLLRRRPAADEEEYLRRLGGYLVLYFPIGQALDILADYEEYLSQEEGGFAQSLRRWGSPEQALQTLLGENPGARGYCRRWTGFWAIFLLLSAFCAFYGKGGLCSLLLLLPIALLGLTRAWGRWQVERRFPPRARAGRLARLPHALVLAGVLLLETQLQLLARRADSLPVSIGGVPIGRALAGECLLLGLMGLCLLVFCLLRSVSHSVRYLSGAFHALGALLFTAWVRDTLRALSSPQAMAARLLFPLICYALEALLALLFALLTKPGRSR